MRVYISGQITGKKDYKERFEAAEKSLTAKGYKVINPAKLAEVLPDDLIHEEYMAIDMVLLTIADAIYMLEGWTDSSGARKEFQRALSIEKKILYESIEKHRKA
jgi:hypothetical protein